MGFREKNAVQRRFRNYDKERDSKPLRKYAFVVSWVFYSIIIAEGLEGDSRLFIRSTRIFEIAPISCDLRLEIGYCSVAFLSYFHYISARFHLLHTLGINSGKLVALVKSLISDGFDPIDYLLLDLIKVAVLGRREVLHTPFCSPLVDAQLTRDDVSVDIRENGQWVLPRIFSVSAGAEYSR